MVEFLTALITGNGASNENYFRFLPPSPSPYHKQLWVELPDRCLSEKLVSAATFSYNHMHDISSAHCVLHTYPHMGLIVVDTSIHVIIMHMCSCDES